MDTIITAGELSEMFHESYRENKCNVLTNGLVERDFSARLSTGTGTFKDFSFDGLYVGSGELALSRNTQVQYTSNGSSGVITMLFILSGCTIMQHNGLAKPITLGANRHNLFYLNGGKGKKVWSGHPSKSLRALEISLSPDFFTGLFPDEGAVLQKFMVDVAKKKSTALAEHSPVISTSMLQIINDILNMDGPDVLKKVFLSSKILELLMLQVNQMRQYRESQTVTKDIKEKMFAVKDFLDAKVEADFSLHSLAKEFVTNEFTLKKQFKLLFGTSVFNYWNEVRFSYSKQLLRNGNSIQQVAYKMGYSSPQNFSSAFKKRYGYVPSHFKNGKC